MNQTVKHKLTSVLLAFVLAFSTLGATSQNLFTDIALGEETTTTNLIEVGSSGFPSDKLNGEYQLTDYVGLSSTLTVESYETATIDLNGKTLAGPYDNMAINIKEYGRLTIIDNAGGGTFLGGNSGNEEEISNSGELIIRGGTFGGAAQKIVANSGSLTIYDGRFDASSNYAIYNEKCDVSILGGLFTSSGEAATIYNNATMSVTGGTFRTSINGQHVFDNAASGKLIFNGLNVNVKKEISSDTTAVIQNTGSLTIGQGSFTNLYGEVVAASEGSIKIVGGTLKGLYPISLNSAVSLSVVGGTVVSNTQNGTLIRDYDYLNSDIYRDYVSGGAFSHSVSTLLTSDITVELKATIGEAPYTYEKNFTKAVESAVIYSTGATISAVNNKTVATNATAASVVFKDDNETLATVYQDIDKNITLPTLTKEGNQFYGWNDGTKTYTTTYKMSDIDVGKSVTLTAQWTPPETEDPAEEPTEDPNEDPSGEEPEDESNIVVVDKEASGMTVDPDSKLDVAEGDKVRVEVWPVYKRSDEYKTIAGKISELSDLTGVYDASLFVNGVKKTDGFGSITLLFPVDTKYNDSIARVWYIHDGKEPESKYSVVVDGKVSVTTSQLSVFGVEILDPSEYPSTEKPNIGPIKSNTQPMYRLYNPNSGEHLYTADEFERDCTEASGWDYEGVAWIAPIKSNTPVYRLYSGTDHHYTTDVDERDMLLNAGWTDEGIGWYSDDAQGVALYRLFNPNVDPSAEENNSGSHHYTADRAESSRLANSGWIFEYIGWYGVKVASEGDEASESNVASTVTSTALV